MLRKTLKWLLLQYLGGKNRHNCRRLINYYFGEQEHVENVEGQKRLISLS